MSVKTLLTLQELQALFPSYDFIKITPASLGIQDTTYIVENAKERYILKKYEREIANAAVQERALLKKLKSAGFNTPLFIEKSHAWYLYEKLKGEHTKVVTTAHIQSLARCIAQLHSQTYKMQCSTNFIEKYPLAKMLNFTKSSSFFYYKKLQPLLRYRAKNDGIIHGDIFQDNTVFEGTKIGLFDFIDAGCGAFAFDVGVALLSFNTKKRDPYFINLFLNTYNQNAPKKLDTKTVQKNIQTAARFYALLRINLCKKTHQAKELL
jgi:Ser/Thr protein kinase RdoA (MazF antagonist)